MTVPIVSALRRYRDAERGRVRVGHAWPTTELRARELVNLGYVVRVPPRAPSFDGLPDWRGKTVMIVAGGPSAAGQPFAKVHRKGVRALAVNNAWRLVPWADVLYACDDAWWRAHGGCREFLGAKVTQSPAAARDYGLHLVRLKPVHRIVTEPGTIGSGQNGGFQAINLAVQLGARRLLLVGIDCTLAHGTHWHGPHAGRLHNPTASLAARWRAAIDGVAGELAALGVEVVNCSAISALTAYPKKPLEEALACS